MRAIFGDRQLLVFIQIIRGRLHAVPGVLDVLPGVNYLSRVTFREFWATKISSGVGAVVGLAYLQGSWSVNLANF